MDQLLDNTVDTYWQSDGPQPHLVNIQFRRKTTIHDVCIYTDYKADESYTPNRSIPYYVYLLVNLTKVRPLFTLCIEDQLSITNGVQMNFVFAYIMS